MGMELFGVALGSLGGGMGEASLLALAGKLDDDHGGLITAFSSGTGLAGVFGFAWHVFFCGFVTVEYYSKFGHC